MEILFWSGCICAAFIIGIVIGVFFTNLLLTDEDEV